MHKQLQVYTTHGYMCPTVESFGSLKSILVHVYQSANTMDTLADTFCGCIFEATSYLIQIVMPSSFLLLYHHLNLWAFYAATLHLYS